MHVLGFFHEQNSMDRDKYLNIYEENMKDGMLLLGLLYFFLY